MTFLLHAWVETPDGQGEIVAVPPGGRYQVQLADAACECSGDNLCEYAASELALAAPPRWFQLKQQGGDHVHHSRPRAR